MVLWPSSSKLKFFNFDHTKTIPFKALNFSIALPHSQNFSIGLSLQSKFSRAAYNGGTNRGFERIGG